MFNILNNSKDNIFKDIIQVDLVLHSDPIIHIIYILLMIHSVNNTKDIFYMFHFQDSNDLYTEHI